PNLDWAVYVYNFVLTEVSIRPTRIWSSFLSQNWCSKAGFRPPPAGPILLNCLTCTPITVCYSAGSIHQWFGRERQTHTLDPRWRYRRLQVPRPHPALAGARGEGAGGHDRSGPAVHHASRGRSHLRRPRLHRIVRP